MFKVVNIFNRTFQLEKGKARNFPRQIKRKGDKIPMVRYLPLVLLGCAVGCGIIAYLTRGVSETQLSTGLRISMISLGLIMIGTIVVLGIAMFRGFRVPISPLAWSIFLGIWIGIGAIWLLREAFVGNTLINLVTFGEEKELIRIMWRIILGFCGGGLLGILFLMVRLK